MDLHHVEWITKEFNPVITVPHSGRYSWIIKEVFVKSNFVQYQRSRSLSEALLAFLPRHTLMEGSRIHRSSWFRVGIFFLYYLATFVTSLLFYFKKSIYTAGDNLWQISLGKYEIIPRKYFRIFSMMSNLQEVRTYFTIFIFMFISFLNEQWEPQKKHDRLIITEQLYKESGKYKCGCSRKHTLPVTYKVQHIKAHF